MTATETRPRGRWLFHDVVMGLLSGAAVGTVIGLFVAVRGSFDNMVTLAGTLIGAVAGVYMLIWSHRRNEHFLTATVVITWFLFVASAAWLGLLAYAIATFQ